MPFVNRGGRAVVDTNDTFHPAFAAPSCISDLLWYNLAMLNHIATKPPKERPPLLVGSDTPLPLPPPALLRFDGACNPNPGPMGIGYLLSFETRELVRVGAQIGQGTNNRAEYEALLSGMRHALKLGLWNLEVRGDSMLAMRQMTGEWKPKDTQIKKLHAKCSNLARLFARIRFQHVPREHNMDADALSRKLVFEEPSLPPPLLLNASTVKRNLLPWQAAAVRVWWLTHHPGGATLGDIFGMESTGMEKIGHGHSYREATFTGHVDWINSLLPRNPS